MKFVTALGCNSLKKFFMNSLIALQESTNSTETEFYTS